MRRSGAPVERAQAGFSSLPRYREDYFDQEKPIMITQQGPLQPKTLVDDGEEGDGMGALRPDWAPHS